MAVLELANKNNQRDLCSSSQNRQYELFTIFLTNDITSVSNTIDVWEGIPKYFITPLQAKKLQRGDGLAKSVKKDYKYKTDNYSIKIQPAQIKKANDEKAYFPGIAEELVEEALKKILSNQNYGVHNIETKETSVLFTLNMVKKELDGNYHKRRNKINNKEIIDNNQIKHSRSLTQIKHSLKILSRSSLTLYKDGKEIWTGSILQDYVTVDRQQYLKDSSSYHIARFPIFITNAINKGDYRQINFHCLMSFKSQLTRWLYKLLVNRYRQASIHTEYNILYSTIKNSSLLLEQAKETDNRKKIIATLEELKDKKVITSYKANIKKDGRKIIDVNFILQASKLLETEQKAANKRAKNALWID